MGKRWALVIINVNYDRIPALPVMGEHATRVAEVLLKFGFEVDVHRDVRTHEALAELISEAKQRVSAGDLLLLHAAGHGARGGVLLPTGAMSRHDGFNIVAALKGLECRLAVICMDACRRLNEEDHVVLQEGLEASRKQRYECGVLCSDLRNARNRGTPRSIDVVEFQCDDLRPRSTNDTQFLFCFGTGQDCIAWNGAFSRILHQNLLRPGVRLTEMLRAVREEVAQESQFRQVPCIVNLSNIDVVLQAANAETPAPATSRRTSAPRALQHQRLAWSGLLASGTKIKSNCRNCSGLPQMVNSKLEK